MVEKRARSFIEDLLILMRKEQANVAIAAHGNSMRPFRRHFEKLTVEEMMELANLFDQFFDYAVSLDAYLAG